MCRNLLAVALLAVLVPARLVAGGPPVLCVPIEGITAQNAATCAKHLDKGLADVLEKTGPLTKVKVHQEGQQWYVIFPYNQASFELGRLEKELEGTGFTVPREKMHFFGLVTFDIDKCKVSATALAKDLGTLPNVTVEETTQKGGRVSIEVKTPYWEPGMRDIFRRVKSETRNPKGIRVRDLPSYRNVLEVVSKHGATIAGVRWQSVGCRMIGCVTADFDQK